jgi:SOS-response transcriptional repressor LexA
MYKNIRFSSEVMQSTEPMVGELRLTDYLMEHPAVSLLYTMRGPSMCDLGVLDGDQLIMERGRIPQPGDIVLAILDDNFVVRQYQLHQGKPYLQAGNSGYGSIMPAQELQIS